MYLFSLHPCSSSYAKKNLCTYINKCVYSKQEINNFNFYFQSGICYLSTYRVFSVQLLQYLSLNTYDIMRYLNVLQTVLNVNSNPVQFKK